MIKMVLFFWHSVFNLGRDWLLWPHGLQPAWLFCPWDFAGKTAGVGCHFFLQGIFQIQGLNPHFLFGGFVIQWATKKAPRWHFSHKNSISCFKKRQKDPLLSRNKVLCTSTDNKKPPQLWTQSSPINLLKTTLLNFLFIVVQWISHVWFFAIPWDAAHQASLFFTISWSMLKFMSTESVMPLVKVSFCIFGLAYESPGQVFKLQFLCYSQINSTCW